MESYGAILREAREQKGLTVSQVAKATSISDAYIKALEEEDVRAFPGEPYLVGFLRNYSNYLGTNSEELIRYYNAVKIQESPVPVELLEKHTPKFVAPLIITLCSFLLIGLGIFIYFGVLKVPERKAAKAQEALESTKSHQYEFTGEVKNVRLYKEDQILLQSTESEGKIVLTVRDTKGSLSIDTPSGMQVVELSEERGIDVNGDNIPDIILYVSDVDMKDGTRGAEVRMLSTGSGYTEFISVDTSADEDNAESGNIVVSNSSTEGNARTVIKEDTRAYPFTVNISFRGSCVLRYQSDRKDFVEDYFHTGDTISVSSQNGFRIWASNISVLKLQVVAGLGTYDIGVGKAGEIEVEDIKWVRDSDGMYRLVVEKLD